MTNLKKEYVITVQDIKGETLQVFGDDHDPSDEEVETCFNAVEGGFAAFVDKVYRKSEE